jgi:gliding motility-associated-like protein
MNKLLLKLKIICICVLLGSGAHAQITIVDSLPALSLAQMLAGTGVTVSNAYFNAECDSNLQAGKFFVTSSNLGLDSGIILSTGHVTSDSVNFTFGANGAATNFSSTQIPPINTGTPDTLLSNLILIPPGQTSQGLFDRCALEFDFTPQGDTVKFDYVFASEEFPSFSCTQFTDVFGFFITGPGIPNPVDMAVVPGTSLPVMINTINSGGNITNWCTVYGAGVPYTTYFVNNAGTTVCYSGMTTVLPTAPTAVTPCVPYHLKIEIADVGDESYDSGVFLKAGSLTSNAITLTPLSALSVPEPYVVEGCSAGGIMVTRPVAAASNYTVHYGIAGTATMGVDYQTIPDSIVILAGNTSAIIPIVAFTDALIEGFETVTIYRTASCSLAILDSTTIRIYDSLQLRILSNDTNICIGKQVNLFALADTNLSFAWTPNYNIVNGTTLNPTVSPNVGTWYTITASLTGSGCPPVKDSVHIGINTSPSVNLGPDVYLCKNMTNQFNPVISPNQVYTYSWTPSTYLSSGNIPNPVGTFTNVGTFSYIFKVAPTALGCDGYDTIVVEVLPNDFTLVTKDTNICAGQYVHLDVNGDPRFHYQWSPNYYLSNDTIQDPFAGPMNDVIYNVVATYPGCPNMGHSVKIGVEPVPVVNVGADREMCIYDTIRILANVQPDSFLKYIYKWNPSTSLSNDSTNDVIFSGFNTTSYTLTVTTPLAQCKGTDNINLVVWPTNFTTITPVLPTYCPNISIPLNAGGGVTYHWEPNWDISDNNIKNPIVYPVASLTYTLYATSIHGCIDTNEVHINRVPAAVLEIGSDVTLYPGDTYTFPTGTNCSQFVWAPITFLDYSNIQAPTVSSATVSTQYVALGTTENGCSITDTVTITVSPNSILAIPNAFTPGNGNSPNNNFILNKLGFASLNYFRIFNRWGEMVFETTDINKGWNGKKGDVPQPLGVYIYNIEAVYNNGQKFNKTGNVTLIR